MKITTLKKTVWEKNSTVYTNQNQQKMGEGEHRLDSVIINK